MSVYVVLIEDRHAEADVELWPTETSALSRMRELAQEYNSHPDDLEEPSLSDAAIRDGWVGYIRYSCESDRIRVLRREMVQ